MLFVFSSKEKWPDRRKRGPHRIGPVGDQAAAGDVVAEGVDRRQPVPGRKGDNQIAMNHRQRAARHDQAAVRPARECGNAALDLASVARLDRAHVHAERRRHSLDCTQLAGPGALGAIPNDRGA
jgi:hypothetical protein